VLAKTLDAANGQVLDHNKSPARKIGELDNRGSHYYLALYWAQALAAQDEDPRLKAVFTPLARTLADQEAQIVGELNGAQGKHVDSGGYYRPALARVGEAMRPSPTFNAALATHAPHCRRAVFSPANSPPRHSRLRGDDAGKRKGGQSHFSAPE
jgi:isocitrate dehydrogenase